MAKKYTEKEVLAMAVGLAEADKAADFDRDGEISPADARILSAEYDGRLAPVEPVAYDKSDFTGISKKALDDMMSQPGYSFDPESEPLFRQYKELYEKEGARAAENAFGLASSNTGGYANSYAASVAAEAYESYLDRLAEKAGELDDKAYKRYSDERSALADIFDSAADYEDRLYSRYRDYVDDWYKDSERWDEKNSEELSNAIKLAQLGDYTALDSLGVDTSKLKAADERERAAFFADYLDYSLLKKLGVDTSQLAKEDMESIANIFASYGDYSLLTKLGFSARSQTERDNLEKAVLRARLY